MTNYRSRYSLLAVVLVLLQRPGLSFTSTRSQTTRRGGSLSTGNRKTRSLADRSRQSTAAIAATTTTTLKKSMFSQDDDLEGGDKVRACVPYLLPLLDGDHFGQYFYERLPPLGLVHDVLLGGLVNLWDTFPFAGFVFFLALTLGTRGNTEMNRNVRFSAQQAALIDVSLIVPELIAGSFEGEDVPRQILEPCSNFTYYYLLFVIGYCIFFNLRGKKPDNLPYISEYSELMTGPF